MLELTVFDFSCLLFRPLLYGLVSHFMNSENSGKVFLRGAFQPGAPPGSNAEPRQDAES